MSNNAIERREERSLAPGGLTPEQYELVKRTVFPKATDDELQLYIHDCQRQGVHPLDKLIHPSIRTDRKTGQRRYTAVTSIDLMRSRADATGSYAGNDDPVFSGTPASPDFVATVTVWKIVAGSRVPFTATARWTEYKPEEDFMWRRMPHTMLGKCAEALALRKGFPRELAGLYAREEIAEDAQVVEVRPNVRPLTPPVLAAPDPAPAPSPDPMEGGTEILATLADGVPGIPADAPKPVFDATRDPLPLMQAMMAIHDVTRDPDHEAAVKLEALRHEWETSRSKSRPWDEERVRVYWYEVAFYLAGRAGDYPLLQRYGLALTETWKDEKARPSSLYDAYKAAKKRCLTKKGSTQ